MTKTLKVSGGNCSPYFVGCSTKIALKKSLKNPFLKPPENKIFTAPQPVRRVLKCQPIPI
jgi:hypothetical protein